MNKTKDPCHVPFIEMAWYFACAYSPFLFLAFIILLGILNNI